MAEHNTTPNPRKAELIALSQKARALRESGSSELERVQGELTINNIIISLFYPAGEYETFKGWKARGYQVQKGSKGFPVWSKKRTMTRTDEQTGEEEEFKAFSLAYLFHESQVKAIEHAAAA